MPQTCRQCTRLNPDEAAFCHYEGRPLGKPGAPARRVVSCLAPFFAPFVFPSGRSCGNFDQLAQGCLEEWDKTIEMLRRGYLESFFVRIDRQDLATAARAAAHDPDVQGGLDHLLELLPTSNEFLPPRLRIASLEINLGPMRVGEDRKLDLVLTNGGMRLLSGTVVSGALWLGFGESPTATEKSFQFLGTHTLPLHVRGRYLRAGPKPLEGQLLFASNGGDLTVTVRATVAITPFADGILAGASSPRQLVDKSRPDPGAAAVLFESGAVAAWYRENGWTYPVQEPAASGVAAVQQFVKALGLPPLPVAPPPLPIPPPLPPAVVVPPPLVNRTVPFAEGVLAGARTPEELAEKARMAPREAAALLEGGAVARWYQSNGWTYPVRGPTAAGIDAVLQFLHALGMPPELALPRQEGASQQGFVGR